MDCMMLALLWLQKYMSREIQRGKAGLGNFHLKPSYKKLALKPENIFFPESVTTPQDIVSNIKNTTFREWDENQKPKHTMNSTIARAHQIINSDGISFSAKLGLFTVRGTSEKVSVVHSY